MKIINNRRGPQGRQAGQGMAEYIIIVALVAVAGIATWGLVGNSIGQSAAGVASAIAGTDASDIRKKAEKSASDAADKAGDQKTLSNYADGNKEGDGT